MASLVDGSTSSRTALSWAVRRAQFTGAVVEPVIAWERPLAWSAWVPPGGEPYDFESLAEAYPTGDRNGRRS